MDKTLIVSIAGMIFSLLGFLVGGCAWFWSFKNNRQLVEFKTRLNEREHEIKEITEVLDKVSSATHKQKLESIIKTLQGIVDEVKN